MTKFTKPALGLALMAGFVGSSFAAGPDLSSLVTAVDLSTVSAGILAIAAVMLGPKIVQYAANKINQQVPGRR